MESGQQQESEEGDLEAERLLRLPEVLRLVGLAKSTVYGLIKAGLFPGSGYSGSPVSGVAYTGHTHVDQGASLGGEIVQS